MNTEIHEAGIPHAISDTQKRKLITDYKARLLLFRRNPSTCSAQCRARIEDVPDFANYEWRQYGDLAIQAYNDLMNHLEAELFRHQCRESGIELEESA